jgi:xanthine dehydrogenase accessory factor
MSKFKTCVLIRGGGDLASGVVLRLFRSKIPVVITELANPLAVRRLVSFAEAVYDGEITIEGISARLVPSLEHALEELAQGRIPVLIDPQVAILPFLKPVAVIDARMIKKAPETGLEGQPFTIGLGPGFEVGVNCHAVVETKRGPYLGRVYWQGSAEADTGIPETVGKYQAERVLRAPADGIIQGKIKIGDVVQAGQIVAEVGGIPVSAPFEGIVRGLLHDGLSVKNNLKIGDLDPRFDDHLSRMVSDKALAIGGAVLEALLSQNEVRSQFWH